MPETKLNCPFCGGTARIIAGWNSTTERKKFKVYCTRCQVRQVLQKTKKGAIEMWNRRVNHA